MGAALEGIVRQRSGIGVEKFTPEHPIEISDKLASFPLLAGNLLYFH